MNGLIRGSLGNPYAVTVMSLTLMVLGVLSINLIPIDILACLQESGRSDADFLQWDVGQ